MKNLADATERICELKGSLCAIDALLSALILELPAERRAHLLQKFAAHVEIARTVLLHTPISEHTINAFERDVHRTSALLQRP